MSTVRHHDVATRPIAAIAHPVRLAILDMVVKAGRAGLSSGSIARRSGLSAPAASHHLSWLTDAGLLNSERIGKSVIYRGAGEVLGALIRALEARLGGIDEKSAFAWRPRTTAGPRTAWLRVTQSPTAPARLVWPDLRDGAGHWRATAAPPYQRHERQATGRDDVSEPATGQTYDATVFHGGKHSVFRPGLYHRDRGIYFATDRNYAAEFGGYVHRCRVKLTKPIVYDEGAANSTMEIDRRTLMAEGYDGRIVLYDDGELDVIAFHPHQVQILGKS